MSVSYGNIKLRGLSNMVLSIDENNQQCFKGEPTTNLVTNPTFLGENGTRTNLVSQNWTFSGGSIPYGFTFYDRNGSLVRLKYPKEGVVISNGVDPVSNKRLYVSLNPITPPGETYTFSVDILFQRGFSSAPSNFQYDASNNSITSGDYMESFGTFASNNGYSLGEWFRYQDNFTAVPTAVRGLFGPVISRTNDILVAMQRIQIENKPYATPFVNGTRGNNESLFNLINGESINVGNTSFPTPNRISFNGTSDYINIPYNDTDLDGDPLFTVEGVFKRTASYNGGGPWGIGGNVTSRGINSYTDTNNKISVDVWGETTFDINQNYPLDEYIHVVWVKHSSGFSTSSIDIYVNGVRYTDGDFTVRRSGSTTVNLNTSTEGITLGRLALSSNYYHAPFEIPVFRVYKGTLSQSDIEANFSGLRTRFNIN